MDRLPVLAPCVLAVPFEASAHSDVTRVIRPPCCVGVSSCRYLLASHDLLQNIMYSWPVPKSKWCVYAVTVHVCAVKRLHTRNLGLKINNFATVRYTNRGPLLVLAKTGTVTYKIQHHHQSEPYLVHVDKLIPHYPDLGEELHSWIETDHSTQYRDRGDQTNQVTSSNPIDSYSRHTSTNMKASS